MGRFNDVEDIIAKIYGNLRCLGIACYDVGYEKAVCAGKSEDLAGYAPSDTVEMYPYLDLDIRFIEIMMKMQAYQAAADVYKSGKYAVRKGEEHRFKPLSLQDLALTMERSDSPSFFKFKTYFEDPNYANTIIMNVFEPPIVHNSKGISLAQKTAEVVNVARFMITPMAALQKLYQASNYCSNPDSDSVRIAMKRWDEGAALLIGSMEGSETGGSNDGYLIHGLASEMCLSFGVCSKDGAEVNKSLIEALFSGLSALSSKSCDFVIREVEKIESLIKIPLIQASLLSAFNNDKLDKFTGAESIASGYIYSSAVLPYISEGRAANVIKKNMVFEAGVTPVSDGMDDVNCRDIGYLAAANTGVCFDDGVESAGSQTGGSAFCLSQIIFLFSSTLLAFLYL